VQSLQSTQAMASSFRLHNDMHRALEREELRALFQPQVHAQTHRLLGFETLMRWQHHELGLISPVQFIPMAEDNGQIVPMGRWILDLACQQAATWMTEHTLADRPLRVAVNLSMRQFGDPDIVAHVAQALDTSGLTPQCLELEITEGTAMLDLQHTLKLLNELKALGVRLAIDDRAIANAVIGLAHSLGMSVIAEGVEQPNQRDLLVDLGCDELQGYLFGKPMPHTTLPGWARDHRARWAT
jgi:EAL domain-containing protein (putative c-di-GMP-specific phosphodiesterase class I)